MGTFKGKSREHSALQVQVRQQSNRKQPAWPFYLMYKICPTMNGKILMRYNIKAIHLSLPKTCKCFQAGQGHPGYTSFRILQEPNQIPGHIYCRDRSHNMRMHQGTLERLPSPSFIVNTGVKTLYWGHLMTT
jgi:hypothetical protein